MKPDKRMKINTRIRKEDEAIAKKIRAKGPGAWGAFIHEILQAKKQKLG